MQASITLPAHPTLHYLLRLADSCLVLAQRLGQWAGHAPVLEEDIALSNMALDLLGQARALLSHAGALSASLGASPKALGAAHAQAFTEDQLAFLREERDYFNVTLVELPGGPKDGDFAFTVLRNFFVATWLQLIWQRLAASNDAELSGIAGKAVKEARYHQQHAADWVVRLGDGTAESHQRCQAALQALWRFTPEMLEGDAVDAAALASGLGPDWAELRAPWLAQVGEVLAEATLTPPADIAFRSHGKRGVHSEHMGFLLAEMQHLQRAFPGGVW